MVDQLRALRNKRIIGRQFLLDLRLTALLDMQHLLHLVPHCLEILEVESREGPDLQPTTPFNLGDALALIASGRSVVSGGHNILPGQPASVGT